MIRGTTRILRYGRCWLTGHDPVEERHLELERSDRTVPASLFLPATGRRPLPSWVVLHGMTRRGRAHESLQRFVRAVAGSGAAVIVPEVPEWVELDLAPATTVPSVRASVDALRREGVLGPDGRPGLVGFSFGAPQGLVASTDPTLADELAAVVGFGGYCDLERTVRFQLTGLHRWAGTEHRLRPDPYGRWIIGANFVPTVPGFEGAGAAADALRALAREAGDVGEIASSPVYDASKRRLREELRADDREVFDFFAPPSDEDPDPARVERWVERLVESSVRVEPLMDPRPWFDRVRGPVHLLHGENDRLIPYTETLRLAERLPAEALARATVTGLFAHSTGHEIASLAHRAREAAVFVGALGRVLAAV